MKFSSFLLALIVSFPAVILGQCNSGAIYAPNIQKCLEFYSVPLDFQTAEAICVSSGGHLMSIHNQIENNYLTQLAVQYTSSSDGPFWLGAQGIQVSNNSAPEYWHWTDGTLFSFQNFKTQQLNFAGEVCAQFSSGKWSVNPCNGTQAAFICQNSPKNVNLCPQDYIWNQDNNFCYKLVPQYHDYNGANSLCQSEGAQLASVHSPAENLFLSEMTPVNIWIGLYYSSGQWKWSDGTNVEFLNWGPKQPDNMKKEFWVELNPTWISNAANGGQWNNIVEGDTRPFICKRANQ